MCGSDTFLTSFHTFITASVSDDNFINATAVLVVWDPPLIPNGILSYTVDIQISGTPPFTARVSADTSEEFGGLSPATMYVVTVRGMTSGGTGEAISLAVTTPPCEW